MIVENKGGKGNPNHDELGRFSESPSEGTSSEEVRENEETGVKESATFSFMKSKAASAPTQSASPAPFSFMKQKNAPIDDPNIPSFMKPRNAQKRNSPWEEVKNEQYWREDKGRSEQEVIDNIGTMFTDSILAFCEKWGLKPVHNFGITGTTYNRNSVLLNAFAHMTFVPITIMPEEEYDEELNNVYYNTLRGNLNNSDDSPTGIYERGLAKDNVVGMYFGENVDDFPCIYPDGCHGSCLYTATDQYSYTIRQNPQTNLTSTASSYASSHGSNGFIIKLLSDNANIRSISETALIRKRDALMTNIDKMQANVTKELKNKGKDQDYIDKINYMLKESIRCDIAFTAMLLGYDRYDQGSWHFFTNFRHLKSKRNWW